MILVMPLFRGCGKVFKFSLVFFLGSVKGPDAWDLASQSIWMFLFLDEHVNVSFRLASKILQRKVSFLGRICEIKNTIIGIPRVLLMAPKIYLVWKNLLERGNMHLYFADFFYFSLICY